MKFLDEAKQFFWLRRIALAAERQAAAMEKRNELIEREWTATHVKPAPKKMELGLMDPDEVAKNYLAQLEAERTGGEYNDYED